MGGETTANCRGYQRILIIAKCIQWVSLNYFILNKIKFWKKDGVTIKKFEKDLSIFRSTCNFHEEGTDQFEMKTTGLTFTIGDFDDYLAVRFVTTTKTCYAEIWFRWWAPGVKIGRAHV